MPETINLKFILIQGVGLIGAGIYFLSYQYKDNKKLFRVQMFSFICYTVHFVFLGAYTGAISNLICLLRSYFLSSKNKVLQSKWGCIFICLISLIVCIFTWAGPISLLPVVGNVAVTVGGYLHSEKKLRLIMIFFNAPIWITYDFLVGSFAGVVDEVVTLIAVLISIYRLGWNNLDKKE